MSVALRKSENMTTSGLRPEQRAALPPFHTLRAFEAIVTCGGIRRAAEALSVDHAAVSRHLRALEEWTGVPLIDRAPGAGRRLTEDGEKFYAALAEALGQIADASLALLNQGDDSQLTLICAPGIASAWLTRRIAEFTVSKPEVELELQPLELSPDPSLHSIDAFLQYVPDNRVSEPDPAMRMIEVARPPILPVVSPAFLAEHGAPDGPVGLLDYPLVHEANESQWQRWFAAHGIEAGGRLAGPKFWHNHLTMEAARRGQGVALANALIASDDLNEGHLVALDGWPPVYLGGYQFSTRRNRWREKTITAFRRWLEAAVAQEPLLRER
ncbi:LysR substrate-binding domain-containing protein [Novosphingobium sp. 1949]|uniref:LysR substrate-binding domain-containing protein n=1 Tax=Novosphingobium organovorum TaxID=2930092 RepID=A0ABT0BAR1_9SPHN|nr:LysR substrate-binding domain-containing protein [Novosphingobium organovorum]MCJ2182151.1 LysR substrate-binding domain-containing protein [Novosphingobium organovorum]